MYSPPYPDTESGNISHRVFGMNYCYVTSVAQTYKFDKAASIQTGGFSYSPPHPDSLSTNKPFNAARVCVVDGFMFAGGQIHKLTKLPCFKPAALLFLVMTLTDGLISFVSQRDWGNSNGHPIHQQTIQCRRVALRRVYS